jgi:hypothetical protein
LRRVEDAGELEGFSALHAAAKGGELDVCKYLVEELLVDVDVVDKKGPFHFGNLIYFFRIMRTHSS